MARISALVEVDTRLRQYLSAALRPSDEAVVLPQGSRSAETGALKNIVLRLDGCESERSPDIFSSAWYSGVSVVEFPTEKAELLIASAVKRVDVLERLKKAIPSEMQDSNVQVGPELDGDSDDRDIGQWTCGFDSPSCCVGLFSAVQDKAPDAHLSGMSRAHQKYFLLCKAGAGIAAQTFHARLTAALKGGASLDEALAEDGTPGARALRRVAMAGRRNRCRILVEAANAFGFSAIDTIRDNASPTAKSYRAAIPSVDCSINSLVHTAVAGRSLWQHAAGCVDSAASTGCVSSSNVAEGFVLFTNPDGSLRFQVRNDAHACVPFASQRILSNRDTVTKAAAAHRDARTSQRNPHADGDWVRTHFTWNAKDFGNGVDIEPPGLWGSHESDAFLNDWSRELGLSRAHSMRLRPELVCVSAVEPSKLRVASKSVSA